MIRAPATRAEHGSHYPSQDMEIFIAFTEKDE